MAMTIKIPLSTELYVKKIEALSSGLDTQKVEKKLRLASELFQLAFDVKCFQIQGRLPHLSKSEINHLAYAMIEKGCNPCKA